MMQKCRFSLFVTVLIVKELFEMVTTHRHLEWFIAAELAEACNNILDWLERKYHIERL